MKKISIIVALATIAGIFAGCNKEESQATSVAEGKMVEITLSTDSYPVIGGVDMKTMLTDDLKVHWKKGDKITIGIPTNNPVAPVEGVNNNPTMAFLENVNEDGTAAKFKGMVPETFLTHKDLQIMYPYVSLQPPTNYPKGAALGREYHWTNFNQPNASQELKANSFGEGCNVSLAHIDMTNPSKLTFQNFTGLYELKLKGDATIDKIEITSSVAIVGVAANKNIAYNIDDATGKITDFLHQFDGKTVTLTNEEGITLNDEYTRFYACIAPYANTDATCTIKFYEKGKAAPAITETISVGPVQPGKITKLGEYTIWRLAPLYFRPSGAWADSVVESENCMYFTSEHFAAYLAGEGKEPMWIQMTDTDKDGAFVCDAPAAYEKVTFVRMEADGENNLETALAKTAELVRSDGSKDAFVMDAEADGSDGEWITYADVTTLYFKPNAFCDAKDDGEGATIKSYNAYFRTFTTNQQIALPMTYNESTGLYSIDIKSVDRNSYKYSQVRFMPSGSGDWAGYLGTTLFMNTPLDGSNLFTLDEVEDSYVFSRTVPLTGTWSVKE